MVSLGQGKKYTSIINTEISQVKPLLHLTPSDDHSYSKPAMSQKIQELDMLNQRSRFKDAAASDRRGTTEATKSSSGTDGTH